MTMQYAVGIRIGSKADQVTVEAEDALAAALEVKATHPDATITYVRKQNARGDRRHPHPDQVGKPAAGELGPATPSGPPRAAAPRRSRPGRCGRCGTAAPSGPRRARW